MTSCVPRPIRGLFAFAIGLVVVYVVRASFDFGGPTAAELFGTWVYDTVRVVAIVLLLAAARRPGPERVVWALLAAGEALSLSGDILWGIIYPNDANVPSPSIPDGPYLASYLPMIVAAGWLLRGRLHSLRTGRWLDGIICASAIATVFAVVVLEPVRGTLSEENALAYATQLAYPVMDLLLLAAIVAACALRGWRMDRRWTALCGGAFSLIVADSTYLLALIGDSYAGGGLLDAGWLLPGLLWAWAAWAPRPVEDEATATSRAAELAPVAFGMAAAITFFVEALETDADQLGLTLGFATIAGGFARVALATRENTKLLELSREDAATDALTGLPNRRRLDAELTREDAGRRVLLSFDLDGFKDYNDTFGHPAGDILLRLIGEALVDAVGSAGIAFRVGGDEFAALVDPRGETPGQVGARLSAAMRREGRGFDVGGSFGAVLVPDETATPDVALRLADRRMYTHKQQGRVPADRQTTDVLLAMLAERDPDLGDHVDHVAGLAEAVARRLGMDDGEVRDVRRAAALHDIGKIAVPDAILDKPGPLDDEEFALMRQHTVVGERVIAAAPALGGVASLVRSSHERVDGAGYPDGLAGEEIPLGARIINVCDAYDAMTSERPYKAPMPHEDALAELRRCSGTQFDPAVVEAFLAAVLAPAWPALAAAS